MRCDRLLQIDSVEERNRSLKPSREKRQKDQPHKERASFIKLTTGALGRLLELRIPRTGNCCRVVVSDILMIGIEAPRAGHSPHRRISVNCVSCRRGTASSRHIVEPVTTLETTRQDIVDNARGCRSITSATWTHAGQVRGETNLWINRLVGYLGCVHRMNRRNGGSFMRRNSSSEKIRDRNGGNNQDNGHHDE